jgi:hypothetical protein
MPMQSNLPFSLGGHARTGRGSLKPFFSKFSGCTAETEETATQHDRHMVVQHIL